MPALGHAIAIGRIRSGGAAYPPTVITFTVPAISDETVDCTATLSADAEEWTITESATQPEHGVGWTAAGDPRTHTTAVSGALTLYAWAWSAAGGVSAAPASGETEVIPNPWLETDAPLILAWMTPPWGTLTSAGGLCSQIDDVQPADTYPTGKTAPFHGTASGDARPRLVGQLLTNPLGDPVGQRRLRSTAAELVALINGTNTPITILMCSRKMVNTGDVEGFCARDGETWLNTVRLHGNNTALIWSQRYHDPTVKTWGQGTWSADWHVRASVFDGTNLRHWLETGGLVATTANVPDIATTLVEWQFAGSEACELLVWHGALSDAGIQRQIERSAARGASRGLPF